MYRANVPESTLISIMKKNKSTTTSKQFYAIFLNPKERKRRKSNITTTKRTNSKRTLKPFRRNMRKTENRRKREQLNFFKEVEWQQKINKHLKLKGETKQLKEEAGIKLEPNKDENEEQSEENCKQRHGVKEQHITAEKKVWFVNCKKVYNIGEEKDRISKEVYRSLQTSWNPEICFKTKKKAQWFVTSPLLREMAIETGKGKQNLKY